MGLIWRLLAPKPLKKARRKVRKVVHPVRAIMPKPVKQVRRAVGNVTHPVEALEFGVQNQIVKAVRGGRRGRSPKPAQARADGLPHRFTDAWIKKNVPRMSSEQAAHMLNDMRKRGWSEDELRKRVYPYVRR